MNHGSLLKKFAEDQKVELPTAQRVLDVLYAKALDAMYLNRVLCRLEGLLINTEIKRLINEADEATITRIVEEIIIEDQACGPCAVSCYSDTEKLKTQSFNDTAYELTTWLFSHFPESTVFAELKEGDMVDIQIMRKGKWLHPAYGEVVVDESVLDDVVQNFKSNARGIDLAVDENHEPDHKALAWFRDVYKQGKDALFAKLELTKKGAELLSEGAYKYFSPELAFAKLDEETGKELTNLLVGGAFTNRPFFKAMAPLMASEDVASQQSNKTPHFQTLLFTTPPMMKLLTLLDRLSGQESISQKDKAELEAAFAEVPTEARSEHMTKMVNAELAKFSEEEEPAKEKSTDTGDQEDTAAEPEKEAEDGKADDEGDKPKDDAAPENKDTDGEGDGTEKKDGDADAEPAKEIQANESGNVTLKASEYEDLKARAKETSKLLREKRQQKAEETLKAFAFSESNPTGVVLPKELKKMVDFATSLSEQQEAKFYELFGNLKQVNGKAVGHDGEAGGSQAFREEDKQFYIKFGKTPEEAEKAAMRVYEADNKGK